MWVQVQRVNDSISCDAKMHCHIDFLDVSFWDNQGMLDMLDAPIGDMSLLNEMSIQPMCTASPYDNRWYCSIWRPRLFHIDELNPELGGWAMGAWQDLRLQIRSRTARTTPSTRSWP